MRASLPPGRRSPGRRCRGDQGEGPRRAVQAGVCRLGLLDERVGLRRPQPALDRHHSLRGHVPCLDGKHNRSSSRRIAVDVADQFSPVCVARLSWTSCGRYASALAHGPGESASSSPGQAEIGATQHSISRAVPTWAACDVAWPGRSRLAEADLVVDPQRLAVSRVCRANPPGQRLTTGLLRHQADDSPCPRGEVKTRAGRYRTRPAAAEDQYPQPAEPSVTNGSVAGGAYGLALARSGLPADSWPWRGRDSSGGPSSAAPRRRYRLAESKGENPARRPDPDRTGRGLGGRDARRCAGPHDGVP